MASDVDLFADPSADTGNSYTARDIEVLEGLEPVRRRPGMYIGGTDERAYHHMAAEVLDNSMDEAVAGHASRIEIELSADGTLAIRDNGRGIPVDPHPRHPDTSALEVIMTTLHAGGKFSSKAYETSGGLHGVGISVVNALSDRLEVEVVRDRRLWRQTYSRGHPTSALEDKGAIQNRRGTLVRFHPDPEIFGEAARFRPARLYRMARSKAFLYRGVEIRWTCAPELLAGKDGPPETDSFHFPGGLADFLAAELEDARTVTPEPFSGVVKFADRPGSVEWAVAWTLDVEAGLSSFCNTVPTPQGGTHEQGLRAALAKGLKAYGALKNVKKAGIVQPDDVMGTVAGLISVFVREPEFQGQTKEKLATAEVARVVENAVRDHFDHWLSGHPAMADALLEWVIDRAEERTRRRAEKEVSRRTATRKLRLPGKLADCTAAERQGTEIFIVEGDSAGGSAKQARARANQAVLPLRGKILNVASAGAGKLDANRELSDLVQALGCGTGSKYREDDLRYDKVIIMTDADVDGAHIASLLMTFFYREMRGLIDQGHLYLAIPPLYRLSHGGRSFYARDEADRDEIVAREFKGNAKVEVSRFKGLGEMMPAQLRETTMDPKTRSLLRVTIPMAERMDTGELVEQLMGKKAERRFAYISENAAFVTDLDI